MLIGEKIRIGEYAVGVLSYGFTGLSPFVPINPEALLGTSLSLVFMELYRRRIAPNLHDYTLNQISEDKYKKLLNRQSIDQNSKI